MSTARSAPWRISFLLAGAGILTGGPQHPQGSMAEMLADPKWVPSHALITLGFVAFLAALLLHRRAVALPARTARWTRIAIWGTALQIVEMILHTASSVDHHNLVAGQSTPVLSTHLALAAVAYPVFAVTVIGWIVATSRDRVLASPWIAPLGIAGLAAHGAAAPLAVVLELEWARLLFQWVMLYAFWCVLAAAWPRRSGAPAQATEATA